MGASCVRVCVCAHHAAASICHEDETLVTFVRNTECAEMHNAVSAAREHVLNSVQRTEPIQFQPGLDRRDAACACHV